MSLSALARSPECERLLKFALEHGIGENWEHPPLDCHVNGRILSGEIPVGESNSQELVVHVSNTRGTDKCSVHLSTLIALAMAYIKYQYEAVAEAIAQRGQPVLWELKDSSEAIIGRVMVYANLVAKYGFDSTEATKYYDKYLDDNVFVELASTVRLKARLLLVISEEQEAKIKRQGQNSADFPHGLGQGDS